MSGHVLGTFQRREGGCWRMKWQLPSTAGRSGCVRMREDPQESELPACPSPTKPSGAAGFNTPYGPERRGSKYLPWFTLIYTKALDKLRGETWGEGPVPGLGVTSRPSLWGLVSCLASQHPVITGGPQHLQKQGASLPLFPPSLLSTFPSSSCVLCPRATWEEAGSVWRLQGLPGAV